MTSPLRLGASGLVVLALMLAPSAQAWTLAAPRSTDPAGTPEATIAAWTTDLAPHAFPSETLAAVPSAAACALGDVTGDGIADLAVLVEGSAGSVVLEARAGPDFEEVVWRLATSLDRVLQCAPDLDLDGTLDPIIRTIGATTATANGAAGATVEQAQNLVQQTLDGASGAALVGRVTQQSATGVASNGLGAAQNATSVLLPAAEGAVALLEGSASAAIADLPVSVPAVGPVPPLDGLTATATQAARLQVLDITGAVVATVEIDEAGVQPLALAPVQLSGALPDIAVLSQVTGPVQEAAAGVPRLALYAADGALAWSTQLPATTGLPILVPDVGDLDLDGVGDLIVTTVQQSASAGAGASYTVLSGVDGSILFDSGPAVTGLLSALPLGSLQGAPAILQATLATGASSLSLSALGGTGNVLWTASVDGLARPVNQVLDPYTQDVLGFTDLTGDAVADVAVAVAGTAGDLQVTVLDGLTGAVAWDVTLPNAQELVPVVIGTAQLLDLANLGQDGQGEAAGDGENQTSVADLPGLDGAVDGVEEAAVGATSLLLGVGHAAGEATLTLIDGVSGEVYWTANATLPDLPLAALTAEVAGDLNGDQIQDLLVSAQLDDGGPTVDGAADVEPAVVAAVSGATGNTLWTNATASAAGQAGLDFGGSLGPLGEEATKANDAPGVGPMALTVALVAAVALLRRRR